MQSDLDHLAPLRAHTVRLEALLDPTGSIFSVHLDIEDLDGEPMALMTLGSGLQGYQPSDLALAAAYWCLILEGNVQRFDLSG